MYIIKEVIIMKKIIFLVTCSIVISIFAFISAEQVTRTATIVEIEGIVEVKTPDAEDPVPASVGMVLEESDIIATKDDSSAIIEISGSQGNAKVDLKDNSQVVILDLIKRDTGEEETLLDLAVGKLLIKVDKMPDEKSKFEVKTPTSVVGVRGTKFSVEVEAVEE